MSNTRENLEAAFAGESQANRHYLFFAEKAEKEGHSQIARLFRATAEAETVHARNHLGVMDGIKSTRDNLAEAVGGEKLSCYNPVILWRRLRGQGDLNDARVHGKEL